MSLAEALADLQAALEAHEQALVASSDRLEATCRAARVGAVGQAAAAPELAGWLAAPALPADQEELRERLRDLCVDEAELLAGLEARLGPPPSVDPAVRGQGLARALLLAEVVAPALEHAAGLGRPGPAAGELPAGLPGGRLSPRVALPTLLLLGTVVAWGIPSWTRRPAAPPPAAPELRLVRSPPGRDDVGLEGLTLGPVEASLESWGPLARIRLRVEIVNRGAAATDAWMLREELPAGVVLQRWALGRGPGAGRGGEGTVWLPALPPGEAVDLTLEYAAVAPGDADGTRRFPLPLRALGHLPRLRLEARCLPLSHRAADLAGWLRERRPPEAAAGLEARLVQDVEALRAGSRVVLVVPAWPDEPRELRLRTESGEAVVTRRDLPEASGAAPEAFAFLVDRSASMGDGLPLAASRLGAILEELARLAPEAPVRVVAFDSEPEELFQGTARQAASSSVPLDLRLAPPMGATDLGAALAAMTPTVPGRRELVVLLSDGASTLGEAPTGPVPGLARLVHLDLGYDRPMASVPGVDVVLDADLAPEEVVASLLSQPAAHLSLRARGGGFAGPRPGLLARSGREHVLFLDRRGAPPAAVTLVLEGPTGDRTEWPVDAEVVQAAPLAGVIAAQVRRGLERAAARERRQRTRGQLPEWPGQARWASGPSPADAPGDGALAEPRAEDGVELVLGDRSSRVQPGHPAPRGPLVQTLYQAPAWARAPERGAGAPGRGRAEPEDPLEIETMALWRIGQGDPRLARRGLLTLVEAAPRDPRASTRAGWMALGVGDRPLAARLFERALELAPEDGDARRGRALCEPHPKVAADSLRITLLGDPGLALRVVDPAGEECHLLHPETATGLRVLSSTQAQVPPGRLRPGAYTVGLARTSAGPEARRAVVVVSRRLPGRDPELRFLPLVLAAGEAVEEPVRILSLPGADEEVWR